MSATSRPPVGLNVEAALALLQAYLDARDPLTPELAAARDAVAVIGSAMGRLLPLPAVAEQLSVSVDTVRRLIASGELEGQRLGHRTMRIPALAVVAYRARLGGQGW